MKTKTMILSLNVLLMLSLIIFSGCKKDDDEPTPTTGNISISCKVEIRDGGLTLGISPTRWDVDVFVFVVGGATPLQKAKLDASGRVSFSGLAPGNYDLAASGFIDAIVSQTTTTFIVNGAMGAQVNAGETNSLQMILE